MTVRAGRGVTPLRVPGCSMQSLFLPKMKVLKHPIGTPALLQGREEVHHWPVTDPFWAWLLLELAPGWFCTLEPTIPVPATMRDP